MKALLDTCVISELRRDDGDPRVRQWITELDADTVFLSVITIGELAKGAVLLPESRRKEHIMSWLQGLEQQFSNRILPVDQDVARIWGELTARAQLQGVQIPGSDGLIAATGMRHGLHVATRNTRHFAASGAIIVDPWRG